jgi:hypothetical protein
LIDREGAEGAEGAAGAGTDARGVGAVDDGVAAAAGCGRGGTVGCVGARPPAGTFGAEGRGAGDGAASPDGRAAVGVGSAGVTARDPGRGVLRANGATPGVGAAGVGARGGGGCGREAGRVAVGPAMRPSPKSFSIAPPCPIVITPPHTLHRARTPAVGIFAGSTRKTDRHSGQDTFIALLRSPAAPAEAKSPRRRDRGGDRRRTRSREASWRNSSSRWRARSLVRDA